MEVRSFGCCCCVDDDDGIVDEEEEVDESILRVCVALILYTHAPLFAPMSQSFVISNCSMSSSASSFLSTPPLLLLLSRPPSSLL